MLADIAPAPAPVPAGAAAATGVEPPKGAFEMLLTSVAAVPPLAEFLLLSADSSPEPGAPDKIEIPFEAALLGLPCPAGDDLPPFTDSSPGGLASRTVAMRLP